MNARIERLRGIAEERKFMGFAFRQSRVIYRNRSQFLGTLSALSFTTYALLPAAVNAQDEEASSEDSHQESTVEVNEIVVIADAQNSAVEGVLYRVPDSDELPSLSASEVLRQVPFVTIDQNGNVQLLGRSSVTIIVNGQEIRNPREILEGLRGDQLDSINVITNPSARFPGGSRSGVIELTLREPDGLRRVTLNGSVDTLGSIRTSASPTLEFGDLSITGTLSLAEIRLESSDIVERPSIVERQEQVGVSQSIFTNSTIRYDPSEEISLSTAFFVGWTTSEREQTGSTSFDPNEEPVPLSESRTSNFNFFTITPILSYEREEGDVWKIKVNRTREEVDAFFSREASSANSFTSQQRTFRAEDSLNLDYEGYQQNGRRLRFGAGFERSRWNDTNIVTGVNLDDFEQTFFGGIDEYSAYSDFQFNLGNLRVLPGLRAEYREYPTTTTNVDYLRFFPSLHLERRLERGRMVRASYNRRVSWPALNDVNSAIRFTDGITTVVGNPALLPSSQDTFELSYTKTSGRDQLGITAYAVEERNQFISASELIDDILVIRPENGGSETTFGGSVFLKEGIHDGLRVDLSFNGAYITQRIPDFANLEPDAEFRYTARTQFEYAEDREQHPQTDTFRVALTYRSARQLGLMSMNENLSLEGSWTHRFSEDISTTLNISGINLPRERRTTYVNDAGIFTSRLRDQGLLIQVSVVATLD